jgi:hypothetical protein
MWLSTEACHITQAPRPHHTIPFVPLCSVPFFSFTSSHLHIARNAFLHPHQTSSELLLDIDNGGT